MSTVFADSQSKVEAMVNEEDLRKRAELFARIIMMSRIGNDELSVAGFIYDAFKELLSEYDEEFFG